MTLAQLRSEIEKGNLTPLRRLKHDALAALDLYAEGRRDVQGDAESLATRICDWCLDRGLIRVQEYDYLHGMMTMHARPSATDVPADLSRFQRVP